MQLAHGQNNNRDMLGNGMTGFGLSQLLRLIPVLILAAFVTATIFPSSVWAGEAPRYTLGAGDQVRVIVFGQEDLSGDFELDGSGRISLPLILEVQAGGLTLPQLEASITGKLKPVFLKNPRVSVAVLNYRPFYILGEVRRPGSYPYVHGMTVINAIALAGGYTYRAKVNEVKIKRSLGTKSKQLPANHETIVLPGDVIEVPERFW